MNRREVLVGDYSSAGSEGTMVEGHPVCFALPVVCRKSSRSADNLNLSFQVHVRNFHFASQQDIISYALVEKFTFAFQRDLDISIRTCN